MSNKGKDIKVVSGDGSNLEMSKVYDHISSLKPSSKNNKKKVVIPNDKKNK